MNAKVMIRGKTNLVLRVIRRGIENKTASLGIKEMGYAYKSNTHLAGAHRRTWKIFIAGDKND